jgi:hypothetical protein
MKYHVTERIQMNKAQRGKLHRAINRLSGNQVAAIVRKEFPRAKGGKVDELANPIAKTRFYRSSWTTRLCAG